MSGWQRPPEQYLHHYEVSWWRVFNLFCLVASAFLFVLYCLLLVLSIHR